MTRRIVVRLSLLVLVLSGCLAAWGVGVPVFVVAPLAVLAIALAWWTTRRVPESAPPA